MTEAQASAGAGTPLRRFVDRHLALLGALFLVVIAILRVYFVAGFDMPTALSVLAIVDRTQLLTSSVLTGMVLVVPLIFIQPAFRKWVLAGNRDGAPFSAQMRTALLWIPLSGIVLSTFTVPLLIGWLVGWIVYLVIHRWASKRAVKAGLAPPAKNAPLFDQNTNNWIAASALGFLAFSVLLQPWLAREAVSLRGGEQVVGSVVGTQGEMTLLLAAGRRGAQWVATEGIESRELCRDRPEWYAATLLALLPRDGIACRPILEADAERRGS
ncbi:hypothetical protein [Microbacterium sp. LMI1x-1-1.1]|uniref:hypothetical protein n=1 Tax=Microbacterium sp. LMI1x-1-1.1 TaxID=3135246 RepID=UPI00341B985E